MTGKPASTAPRAPSAAMVEQSSGPAGSVALAYADRRDDALVASAGVAALAAIVLGVIVVVMFGSAGSRVFDPRVFPLWETGPLRDLLIRTPWPRAEGVRAYSELLVLMACAYGVALMAARELSIRLIWGFVILVNLILLLGPPLPLNDVFNYLGYARLAGRHGLNPYTHVIAAERHDPIYALSSWRHLESPYGPLFTALTMPLGWLPLPVAYWVLKSAIVAASLAFVWVVHRLAVILGRDPRFVVLFVAANPLYVFFAVGGFHNDFLMLLPSMAAIALVLRRHDRAAGAVLMLAVAIKFTAIVLLPFLLIAAARAGGRRAALRVLGGTVLAGIPLAALTISLFGFALPNVAQQSTLITGYSIPNLTAVLLDMGGTTPGLMRLADVAAVLVVVWGLRRRDWVSSAGFATVALIASFAWLMPWYIVWALPLAALSTSVALRTTVLALTLFLVLTFIPVTSRLMLRDGLNPMAGPVDQAALAFQRQLQYGVHHRSVRIRRDAAVVRASRRQYG